MYLVGLLVHPRQYVLQQWNWKAAVLSAGLRGGIFFAANLPAGLATAARVLAIDAAFRMPLVGVYAAIIQGFAGARPAWAATAMVMILVPAVAHTIEFVVHRTAGTPALRTSVAVSVAFSIVSSGFELFAMRHGAFVVGPGAASLRRDIGRLPSLLGAFVLAVPAGVFRWVCAGMTRPGRQR